MKKLVVKKSQGPAEKREVQIASLKPKTQKIWNSLPEEVAQSNLWFVNRMIPELKEAFPFNPRLWSVDWCFPRAKSHDDSEYELCLDVPVAPYQIEDSRLKAEVLAKSGRKFVALTKGMTSADAYERLGIL